MDRTGFARRALAVAPRDRLDPLTGEARAVTHRFQTTATRIVAVTYPPETEYDTHLHDESYLCLVTGGSYDEWRFKRRRAARVLGDSTVYRAGSRHAVLTGTDGCRIVHVARPESTAARRAATIGMLWQIARSLAEVGTEDGAGRLHLECLLHEIGVDGAGPRAGSWIDAIRERLRDEFRTGVPLDELARSAGRHPAHVARAFRAAWGMTAGEYVRRVRIAAATRLLRDTDEPISAVALATGFADQSHLGRWMQRYVGHSPGWIRSRARR